jgi:hypothetical protein
VARGALTPAQLLAAARDVAGRDAAVTAGLWPRAAALLARQALETAIDDLWRATEPQMIAASARARFLCLPACGVAPGLVVDAAQTWGALSSACHRHAYELPPTAEELDSLFDRVERVVQATAR